MVQGIHHRTVARDRVLASRTRQQRVDVHASDERVGERPRQVGEGRGGVTREEARQDRVDDLDLTRGTERRALTGRGHALHAGRRQQHPADQRRAPHHHGASAVFANASGSKSRSTQRRSVRGPTAITSRSSPNSASSWRQAPHGDAGGSTSVATTMRRNARIPVPPPLATAAPIAMRSAQIVSPYDALSTLVPTYTPPSPVSSAAPTRNLL